MSKSLNHEEDLDLLLSLQDRVLETPPNSPSPSDSPGTSSLKVDFFYYFSRYLAWVAIDSVCESWSFQFMISIW